MDTQTLLSKIAALRQRLEKLPPLASNPDAEESETPPVRRVDVLERQLAVGAIHGSWLDSNLRQLSDAAAGSAQEPTLPRNLTSRARRLLGVGSQLLARLRALGDEPALQQPDGLLAIRYRQTVAMADTALRLVQAYPDSASAQLKLCEGLEATLDVIEEKLTSLTAAVQACKQKTGQVAALTDLLAALAAGRDPNLQSLVLLAEEILQEAREEAPLRFYQAGEAEPARVIACHSLVVAQVAARVARHDPDLRGQLMELVVAALVHDAGMVCIPAEAWLHPRPWTDEERRIVESHTAIGAELARRLKPDGVWLAEACASHHERLDGTGYPAGLRELQIPPLVRLLAVCDVYAALCAERMHRPGHEPRTALADTLLLAEKGLLDRQQTERLLHLSFYPVGAVVELADGSVCRVVANHHVRRDLNTPARPVLVLLTDPHGQPLPLPRYLDLAQVEGHSIVRTLPESESRPLLARQFLEVA